MTGDVGLGCPPHSDSSDACERLHATLIRNELIANDSSIVEQVLRFAERASFSKGDRLIEQGATDDSVYFIVSGSVDVFINKRHIDVRAAPHTVGELAAKKAGEARTADVIVCSRTLEALVLSGSDFRKLMKDFPAFAANLDELIDRLSRSKIAQLGEKNQKMELPWVAVSALVGSISGVIGAVAAWTMGFDTLYIFWCSLPLALIVFVIMLQLNPDFRYRNTAVMAGAALVFWVMYSSMSFVLTIDGENVDLPLIDFSVETEQKLAVAIINVVGLLVLSGAMAYFDLKITRLRETK